jgi:hypothetical protein
LWCRTDIGGKHKSNKFFYITLRHGSPEDIQNMFRQMKRKTRNLIQSVVQLVYFMRGAIQYDNMMHMTPVEREIVEDFIKDRLEQEKGKANPIY